MKSLVIYSVLLTMLLGCSAKGVRTEYQEKSGLGDLKTYGWFQSDTPPGNNVRVNNTKVIEAVRNAVEKNLKQKGYQKVENGKADFLVTWFGAIEEKVQVESINHFYSGYGYGPVMTSSSPAKNDGSSAVEYEEGTILIDVLKPTTQEMLWRGAGSRRILEERKEGDAVLYIDLVVSKIFDNFPQATN